MEKFKPEIQNWLKPLAFSANVQSPRQFPVQRVVRLSSLVSSDCLCANLTNKCATIKPIRLYYSLRTPKKQLVLDNLNKHENLLKCDLINWL